MKPTMKMMKLTMKMETMGTKLSALAKGKTKLARIVALALAAALFAAMASGCGATGKLAKIEKAGTLVVYTDPNFYPFEFPGANGVEGADIEIARAIADDLGVSLTISEAEFDAIVMSIKGGKGDIAISGMTITDDRKENVDFSDPYINSVQYLIVPESSELKTVEDLAGKRIGVAKGYTGSLLIDDEINKEKGVLFGSGASFIEYPSAMEAVLGLSDDKNDAVIMDEFVAKNIVANQTGLKTFELAYADGAVAQEEYGVVVPKGNADLLERINAVIASLKAEDKIAGWVVEFSAQQG